ncbi:winged helix-turn-helix domain-containing protein (plasmid) [Klebsiella sp. BDA134-6]|uniref:winged helix-turn-helix domain-containing protein n=1 Tax=Klebsiella sp. BDA134-6 TaxID=2787706 RepID=UPI00189FFDC8|nr:winged helix-turn-helix domain-containing protein [Klebsiella sp. BDA134-6]QPF30601.1 winged helix-turn-helix domain-containing protein [Klebsiella sp. BDA134-6]
MLQEIYIIKDSIIFWPDRQLLCNVIDESNSVQLTGSASRCLELLLSKNELITQKELYEYAWKDSGITPTPNTLYQSISVLRRAFRELDESDEKFILTETRKGFRFNPLINVISQSRKKTDIVQFNSGKSVIHESRSLTNHALNFSRKSRIIAYSLLTILVTATIIYIKPFSFQKEDKLKILSSYKNKENINSCIFFLPDNIQKNIVDKIDIMQLNCKKRPLNYVTAYSYSSSISIISCNKEIKSRPDDCSVLYIRGKNEIQ